MTTTEEVRPCWWALAKDHLDEDFSYGMLLVAAVLVLVVVLLGVGRAGREQRRRLRVRRLPGAVRRFGRSGSLD